MSDSNSEIDSKVLSEDSKAIARRFYDEVLNQHHLDRLEHFLTPDFVWHEPYDPGAIHGVDASRSLLAEIFQAFPDYRINIENLFSEGEQVAIRWVATGTHLGTFKDYTATHQEIVIPGISMMQLHAGKIAQYWSVLDNFLVLAQMGAFETIAQK